LKPSEKLRTMAELYEIKNQEYGSDYHRHGQLMSVLFPKGVTLNTTSHFGRYAILTMIVAKLGRYVNNFYEDGHSDSLNDIIVYAAMLQELDEGKSK